MIWISLQKNWQSPTETNKININPENEKKNIQRYCIEEYLVDCFWNMFRHRILKSNRITQAQPKVICHFVVQV